MRRMFLRAFGQPPQAMCGNAKIGAAATRYCVASKAS